METERTDMRHYERVGGVQYCTVHHGILDECNSRVDENNEVVCDLAEGHAGDHACEPKDLFYEVTS